MEEDQQMLIGFDYGLASVEVLEVLIDDIEDPALFDEIARANSQRPKILAMLLEHPDTPGEVKAYITGVLQVPVPVAAAVTEGKTPEMRRESLTTKIQRLTISARVQLALKGGREIRGILSRDSNKEVMLSVLDNGKITTSEIELIVKSRSALEEALRRISRNRDWMRNYAIVHGLVTNPKTPPGISISHVSDLKTKDLIILEKNKNVPEAVRIATKKLLHARKPR
ncbi:MAG: hypothetical protein M0024_13440 [Nitrospiraceae bacterium]|nr:hypothetical protein [Nitrospiraceae bacterium]